MPTPACPASLSPASTTSALDPARASATACGFWLVLVGILLGWLGWLIGLGELVGWACGIRQVDHMLHVDRPSNKAVRNERILWECRQD